MDSIKYLLDTNICIHFLKNDTAIVRNLQVVGVQNCFLSEMTLLEMIYGVANSASTKAKQNRENLDLFIERFEGRILPIRPVFDTFATQKTRLRKTGTLISDFDLLIACTALQNNLMLVSRNTKEMNRIEALKLEDWIEVV